MKLTLPVNVQEPLASHELLCQQQLKQVLVWLVVIVGVGFLAFYIDTEALVLNESPLRFLYVAMVAGSPLLIVAEVKWWKYSTSKRYLTAYQQLLPKLDHASVDLSVTKIQQIISETEDAAKTNHLVVKLLEFYRPVLNAHLRKLRQDALTSALDKELAVANASCDQKLTEIASQEPLISARNHIESSLSFLTKRREEMEAQWESSYEGFSWWNKLNYVLGPDFSEIDKAIDDLSDMQKKMAVKHKEDFKSLDRHFEQLKQNAIERISASKIKAERYIQNCSFQENFDSDILQKSLWLSALSVPVSIWSDINRAGNIYDSLRGVNSNFAGMSDADIWWESLFLPAEHLAGLAALTKGAYFEQLVAADTEGLLHKHFNNPDTDIVIDGVAFQLKATDSEAYVYSVDETIPVIATSEVASTTGAIDSGYSNEEINTAIDDALGGTIVDIGDTAVDAILTGAGGLGFFATIQGINHASAKYENGGDAVEAVFEGAGVAIEGTARALVGAAEMGYNVLASRPSRFIGRTLLKGLEKLDEKLFEETAKK